MVASITRTFGPTLLVPAPILERALLGEETIATSTMARCQRLRLRQMSRRMPLQQWKSTSRTSSSKISLRFRHPRSNIPEHHHSQSRVCQRLRLTLKQQSARPSAAQRNKNCSKSSKSVRDRPRSQLKPHLIIERRRAAPMIFKNRILCRIRAVQPSIAHSLKKVASSHRLRRFPATAKALGSPQDSKM